jgi:capsid protein
MGAILDWFAGIFKTAHFEDPNNELLAIYDQDYRPGRIHSSGSDGSKFYQGLSASGSSPILDNRTLMINARSAYHDSPFARAMVDRFADTIIGSGLRLCPSPNYTVLKITPEKAEKWGNKRRDSFHLWASSKKVMADESMNLYQLMRLIEIFQQRDNDYFVRFHYSKKRDLQNPLQLSLVDPLQIRGTDYTSTRGFQYYSEGISRDQNGKEIAYLAYIRDAKDGNYKEVEVPAIGPRSKLRMMAHGFRADYANQARGVSRIGHLLQEFEALTGFTLAQIYKAINQSQITYFVKPSKDAPASNPLDSVTHRRASGPYGSDPNVPVDAQNVGNANLPFEEYVRYLDIQEASFREPGSSAIFGLAEGEDLKSLENTAPSDSFNTFVDSFVSYLAASNSMPIEVLLQKFNSNYSASRAALIMLWRIVEIGRKEKKADILDHIYEAWLEGEIARGRISAPGWLDPVRRAAWMENTWQGDPLPNIDPLNTIKAYKEEAALGAITLDDIARNTNGSSGKTNRAQLTREFEELPIPTWEQKNIPSPSGQGKESEDEK